MMSKVLSCKFVAISIRMQAISTNRPRLFDREESLCITKHDNPRDSIHVMERTTVVVNSYVYSVEEICYVIVINAVVNQVFG